MRLLKGAQAVGAVVFFAYVLVVTVVTPFYNWQYARDNGFIRWVLFGSIVSTAKAVAWPYFVFLTSESREIPSAGPEQRSPTLPASSEPRSFTCREPLPEFTLGRDSN